MRDETRNSYMEALAEGPACLRSGEWGNFLNQHLRWLEREARNAAGQYAELDESDVLLVSIASIVRRSNKGKLKLSRHAQTQQLFCRNIPLEQFIAYTFRWRMSDLLKRKQIKPSRLQDSSEDRRKHKAGELAGELAAALVSESGLSSELKAIAERVGAGKSHKQIAEELRITKYQVAKRIDELKGWICSYDPSHPMVIRYRKQQASVSAGVA